MATGRWTIKVKTLVGKTIELSCSPADKIQHLKVDLDVYTCLFTFSFQKLHGFSINDSGKSVWTNYSSHVQCNSQSFVVRGHVDCWESVGAISHVSYQRHRRKIRIKLSKEKSVCVLQNV